MEGGYGMEAGEGGNVCILIADAHCGSAKSVQPTPETLPGKFCGQKNLVGYSSWCCKELDVTE